MPSEMGYYIIASQSDSATMRVTLFGGENALTCHPQNFDLLYTQYIQ
jgi:hypothetical protein